MTQFIFYKMLKFTLFFPCFSHKKILNNLACIIFGCIHTIFVNIISKYIFCIQIFVKKKNIKQTYLYQSTGCMKKIFIGNFNIKINSTTNIQVNVIYRLTVLQIYVNFNQQINITTHLLVNVYLWINSTTNRQVNVYLQINSTTNFQINVNLQINSTTNLQVNVYLQINRTRNLC